MSNIAGKKRCVSAANRTKDPNHKDDRDYLSQYLAQCNEETVQLSLHIAENSSLESRMVILDLKLPVGTDSFRLGFPANIYPEPCQLCKNCACLEDEMRCDNCKECESCGQWKATEISPVYFDIETPNIPAFKREIVSGSETENFKFTKVSFHDPLLKSQNIKIILPNILGKKGSDGIGNYSELRLYFDYQANPDTDTLTNIHTKSVADIANICNTAAEEGVATTSATENRMIVIKNIIPVDLEARYRFDNADYYSLAIANTGDTVVKYGFYRGFAMLCYGFGSVDRSLCTDYVIKPAKYFAYGLFIQILTLILLHTYPRGEEILTGILPILLIPQILEITFAKRWQYPSAATDSKEDNNNKDIWEHMQAVFHYSYIFSNSITVLLLISKVTGFSAPLKKWLYAKIPYYQIITDCLDNIYIMLAVLYVLILVRILIFILLLSFAVKYKFLPFYRCDHCGEHMRKRDVNTKTRRSRCAERESIRQK